MIAYSRAYTNRTSTKGEGKKKTAESQMKERGSRLKPTSNEFMESVLEMIFSNSLIIHAEKTKKIITVTVVWISDTNYFKILGTLSLNLSKNYCSFEKLYPKLHSVFHPISRHLEIGFKNFFNPLLSVWISDETLRVVLDILLSQ